MEFRILTSSNKKLLRLGYRSPSELTPTERVELIEQSCPEINIKAFEWANQTIKIIKGPGGRILDFTDYLSEHMEVRNEKSSTSEGN